MHASKILLTEERKLKDYWIFVMKLNIIDFIPVDCSLQTEGRIQLRLFHDEVHNTLEIAVVNIAFGNDDCTTIDLNDLIITLRM